MSKRGLDAHPSLNPDPNPSSEKRKRLNLASVVVEAVKYDGMQKLCQSLEPFLRKVVGEEIDRAIAKLLPASATIAVEETRSLAPPVTPSLASAKKKQLRLQFRNKVAPSLFTGSKIEGEHGSPVLVQLVESDTSHLVNDGPEAGLKLDIVVLDGDFSTDDDEEWTQEEFASHEVRERDGKGPLLAGDVSLILKDGVGTLGELSFTDNSSWIRSRKFRLGAKVATGTYQGFRIREAKSDAFVVKDHRGELYKKHYPPELHDEVWRLDKIGKDGAFHRRLYKAGIRSVEEFLRLAVMDPQKLRNILGSGMSNKMWEGTIEHAKTCVLSQKLYVYYADETQNVGIIFNTIYQVMGLISEARYLSVELLSESEKIYVDKLVKVAYENWGRVVQYEGEPIADLRMYERLNQSQHQEQQEHLQEQQHIQQQQHQQRDAYEQQQQQSSYLQQEVARPLAPSLPSTPVLNSNNNNNNAWSPLLGGTEWMFSYKETRTPSDEFVMEEMRARSIEFLENEELLLMLANSSSRERSGVVATSGVRGRWLKIKAAMTWSISIRNIAAARRARAKLLGSA